MHTYSIYWIRYPHHTNPKQEGYIGVTCSLSRRMTQHKYNKNLHVVRALKLGADCEVLHEGLDKDAALSIEVEYRPNPSIGWNIVAGGGMPPSVKGRRRSISHQNKLDEARRGKARSLSTEHIEAIRAAQSNKTKRTEQSKWWKITTPSSEVVIVQNLAAYCRTTNLKLSNMSSVAKGRQKSYKGYKVIKL